MKLEGTLDLERPRRRLWVSAVATVIPVLALVGGAAWFIRSYVAPPMVAVHAPGMVIANSSRAKAPPQPPAPEALRPAIAEQPAMASPALNAPTTREPRPSESGLRQSAPEQPAPPLPMEASLAYAPFSASLGAEPSADAASAISAPARQGVAAPIAGSVPLPRRRPRISVALVTGAVPFPRPRPQQARPLPPFLNLSPFGRDRAADQSPAPGYGRP